MLEWENKTKLEIYNFNTKSTEKKVNEKIKELKVERDEQKKSDIKRSIIEKEIKFAAEHCLSTAKSEILKNHKETLEKMDSFLKSANHSDTLSQWRHETEKKIKKLHDDNDKKAESYCDELVKSKLNHVKVDHQEVVNLVKINSHITELVEKSWKEAKQYSDKELEKMFEDMWEQWMLDFETKTAKTVQYPTSAKIDNAIVTILREQMVADDPLIISKLTKKPFDERTKSGSLKLKIDKEIHLLSSKWYSSFMGGGNSDVKLADEFTKERLLKAREYLGKIKQDSKLFNPSFVQELLQDLFTSLKDLTEKKSKFKFTAEYKVDMALVVCAYASAVFKETTERIKKDNDPVARLNKMKNDFMIKFKNKYKEVSDEKQAAIDLCALLRDSIKEKVEERLESTIVEKLRQESHLSYKRDFNKKILEDLMMKGDFSLYRTYIDDIPRCYRYWIDHYIDDYVSHSSTKITSLAKSHLSKITGKITDTIGIICMEVEITKIKSWLSKFTENLRDTLPLPSDKVEAFVGSCDVKLFSTYINEEFDKIKCKLETKYNNARLIMNDMGYRRNSPKNLLYTELIGCSFTCPFCKEKCDYNADHGGRHSMSIHRPQCLGGYRGKQDQKLYFKTCTEAINSEDTFECYETGYRQVKYSDYHLYFRNLYIRQLAYGEPLYWKWFIRENLQYVTKWAGVSDDVEQEIPPEWYHIRQEDAKNSL